MECQKKDADSLSLKKLLSIPSVLRQTILKKTSEGKLVPQDPADEPAEKLLEQIRAKK